MLGRKPYMKWGVREEDHLKVHEVMNRLGIERNMQGRFLNELSGGELQKVVLCRALAQEPRLMLLDEPTSFLDIKNQYYVLNIVKQVIQKDNITAIMVIHDIDLALRFCNKFLTLKNGEVYSCGDIDSIDENTLKEVYGINAKIVNIEGQHKVLVEK